MARPQLWTVVGVLLLFTLVSINFSVIYVFNLTQAYVDELRSVTTDKDQIKNSVMKWLTADHIDDLKGILSFSSKQIERVMMLDHEGVPHNFMLDVSSDGEYGYLAYHIARHHPRISKFVLDIGAYDGLLGSNSYNFFQAGWNGLVVEPHPKHFGNLKKNLARFVNKGQSIGFARVAMSDYDGEGQLHQFGDAEGMENSLKDVSIATNQALDGQTLAVQIRKVSTLCEEFNVPRKFGVLSIDAEGVGDKILKSFLDEGYRPTYVIYEWLGMPASSTQPLEKAGYRMLATIGFNQIWMSGEDE
eukprot:TRINITY_DN737_c0_g1_i1.p1 TRINITY_DN737_c0_g1~~TRINITY_DN737_c0_g1_i1.p1  ORF type:complete len:302 (+),score=35.71 TRINITY_DN737_c0_g1_i1:1253-2158(+)